MKAQYKPSQSAGAQDKLTANIYSNAGKLHKNEEQAKQGYNPHSCERAGSLRFMLNPLF